MTYFTIVLKQMVMLVIYALIGIYAVKKKILDRAGLNVMCGYITKIGLPLLIFTNTLNGATREQFFACLPMMAATVVMYLLLLLLTKALQRVFGLEGQRGDVYRACSMFGNMGFMGIPIISALFPEEGMLYIAMYSIPDQLWLWTMGVNLTLPSEGGVSYTKKERIMKMINPSTIGIVLASIGILLNLRLPELVDTALVKVGATVAPLGMIYLGGTLCFVDFKEYLKKKEMYGTIFLKMLVLPLLLFALFCRMPGLDRNMAMTICVSCALPTMSTVAMMAQNQGSDGDYAAGMTFMTTLFAVVTMPLVCLATGLL